MLQDGDVLIPLAFSSYYNWAVAGPIVLALQAFQKSIPEVSGTAHLLAMILSRAWAEESPHPMFCHVHRASLMNW